MARALVFVGPSLPSGRPSVPGLTYAPPAVRDDVLAAARAGFALIGLIDGELYQALAVTPREVRQAAKCGSRLVGASSIGALRAAEVPACMTGIGEIFEAYRSGRLEGDDEVAMTYALPDYQPIALPLVNVRSAVASGVQDGCWEERSARAVLEALKQLPFHGRDREALVRAAAHAGIDAAELLRRVRDPQHDLKRRDALALIEALSRELACG